MKERQKRLIEVYDHLRRYYGIHTKGGFAEALHYGRTSMSAAMNGVEDYLTDKLFKNICESYPGVFNLDYLLNGEGELLANGQQMNDGVAAASPSDYREKYIESLEKQVKDKDQQIADLRRDIQLLYKRLHLERDFNNIQANIFSGIAADELPETAHDND